MRRVLLAAAAVLAMFTLPADGVAGQQGPASTGERQSGAGPAQAEPSAPSAAAAPSQQDSLAAAARRAKEKKKDASKPSPGLHEREHPDQRRHIVGRRSSGGAIHAGRRGERVPEE